ncbi:MULTISPECIES: YfhE family protein [Priestia]|jgi:hypothetical protein|uniref:YfhE family protein n=7 Tax=Priestia TaxID=2800373 RepID=D5DXQ9_PRIM1|nr:MULTISPECIES: YfhE family protein [Priestia]AVX06574.1 YfhE family protein [Bacillus sp. Y-01]MBK0009361.1 YfhE family protein [Bacillus sp. S35]MBK0295078.1 YfhE family protein [Bacillus sp. S34]MBU8855165.1 YfhE family protein [Bacillus sp. FJAT-26377]MBZ5482171.1 YfhE family protein [Bacillus sp. T_4]MCF6799166.1 YfhE family protein [Bacillus sp. ET1]MCL9637911.1 YfhE family protein [Bacillus zanthoxyli]MDH6656656.1 hypothetical protein [Bacillus sp. PvP124]MDP9579123.1 hypothetical 
MSEKKRKENAKNTLSSAQEIYYGREFKKADRAGGYTKK